MYTTSCPHCSHVVTVVVASSRTTREDEAKLRLPNDAQDAANVFAPSLTSDRTLDAGNATGADMDADMVTPLHISPPPELVDPLTLEPVDHHQHKPQSQPSPAPPRPQSQPADETVDTALTQKLDEVMALYRQAERGVEDFTAEIRRLPGELERLCRTSRKETSYADE